MAYLIAVLSEFEGKVEERWPGLLACEAPATVDQFRMAERILGASLTEELVEFYQMHNGCVGYPMRHMQIALPQSREDFESYIGRPGFAGPFDVRHSLTAMVASGTEMLHVPLVGAHKGQVYRDCVRETEFNTRAAMSLTALFEDWLYYLDNGYLRLAAWDSRQLGVAGSGFAETDGRPLFDVLMGAWPEANPLTLNSSNSQGFEDFLQRHQLESGMDPRISPFHPDHGEILEFDMAELDRIGGEINDVNL